MIKVFLFTLFISLNVYSSDVIQTGRPGQSIGAGVVGQDIFQIQSSLESSKVEVSKKETNFTTINNILRYGLDDKYETSMVLDINNNTDSSDTELGNFQLGGRVALINKAKKFIPQLCFQTRLQFVDGAGDWNDDLKLTSILSGVFDLKDLGSLTSNLLLNNIGQDDYELRGYTLSWSRNYNEKISYFLEYYSSQSSDEWSAFWDSGIGYLVHNDLALDFSFGTDLDDDFNSHFISFGFSWRKI